MPRYFVHVSHHSQESGGKDDFYKSTQLVKGALSIGWGNVDPINKSPETIKAEIIREYPEFGSTNNPDNGAKSLELFCSMKPGDLVFLRGNAKIIDLCIITGKPCYDPDQSQDGGDYNTFVNFVPLFATLHMMLPTRSIDNLREEILYEGGVKRVTREIQESTAISLLQMVFQHISIQNSDN